jgi:hypothetical protein
MRSFGGFADQKGETKLFYILIGAALTIGVIFLVDHYYHGDRDIDIHVPHVEVH